MMLETGFTILQFAITAPLIALAQRGAQPRSAAASVPGKSTHAT
jgi:hypothetical protein